MSYDNDLDVYYDSIPSKSVLMDYVWSAINAYVSSHATEWFNGWGGYSNIRFNKYKSGTEMRKHWDAIKEIFDGEVKGIPILSVIGLLNDNFTGGDLLISDNKVELSTGDVVIFPSSFMYPHEITKIKSNERYSFVSWVY
jgi:predicted 2-oxoglutarate/Fe(II)-dependent dioxygenase YbiX